jgi:hypothetical protein
MQLIYYNHALNMTISVCPTVVSIQLEVIKETISFLTSSAKRRVVIDSIHEKIFKKLCETRWVERIDGISDFYSSSDIIIKILDEISYWDDITVSSKQHQV